MTSPNTGAGTPVRTARIITFRILTTLSLLAFAFAIPNLLTPWVDIDFQNDGLIQGWRDAVEGTVDALAWVAVLGLILKPLARPLIAQLLIAGALVATTVIPAAGPGMLITISLLLLPILSYPRHSLLTDVRTPDLDRPSLVIAAIAAAVLLPMALAAWSGTDSQAATYAEHLTLLALAGLAMSTRRPGWRWISWPTITAWAYLGIVALTFPSDIDSFGRVGGIACLVVAGAFAATQVRNLVARSDRAHAPSHAGTIDRVP